jgi:hypothetical protein
MSMDDVKEIARDMWVEWAKKYPGSMIEIWIHTDSVTPKQGATGSVFYNSNFKHFAPGSKQDLGTPF